MDYNRQGFPMGGHHHNDGGMERGERRVKFVPGKVFLGGIAADTSSEAISAYCGQWGDVAEAHIMKNYAFVTFARPEDAQRFLETRNHSIDGRDIEAKAAVPKEQSSALTKKMFVGNLNGVDDADFQSYFKSFGNVEDAVILRSPDGTSKGYGFVTFDDEISVEKCLVQEHTINGRQVDCKRSQPRESQRGPGGGQHGGGQHGGGGGGRPRMFVGNLNDVDNNDFMSYFSQFGRVEDAAVLRKPDGSSRGYGFVTFADESTLEMCLNQEHVINGRQVDCKRANPRDSEKGPGGGPGGRFGGGRGGGNMMMGGGRGGHPGMMGGPGMMQMMPMMGVPGGMMPMMPMMGMGGAMMGGHGGGGGGGGKAHGGERGGKQPEWECGQCGNSNLGWRQYCNKCRQQRSGSGMMGGAGGGGGGGMPPNNMMMMGGGGGGNMMPGMGGGMGGMMPGMMPGMNMGMMPGMGGGMPGMNMGGGMPGMMPGMNMGGGGMPGMNPGMNPGMAGMMDGSQAMMGANMMGMPGMGMGGGGGGNTSGGGGGGGYGRGGGRGGGHSNGQARFRPY